MKTVMNLAGGLIEFSGLNFRAAPVSCPTCRWRGFAGQLRSTRVNHTTEHSVLFSCPECAEPIAMHTGLSVEEVQRELASIKDELAAEYARMGRENNQGDTDSSASDSEESREASDVIPAGSTQA